MSRKKTNNEINISINVSDDLLNKFMGAMIKMSSMSSMGGMQMMLGGMMGAEQAEPEGEDKEKASIGFQSKPEVGENG
jgi:hypothetical protein